MLKTFEPYIDPEFEYSFLAGPDAVCTPHQALQRGINCISIAHFVLKDLFDTELPTTLGCAELCTDREMFQEVTGDLAVGDLLWFGIGASDEIKPQDFVPIYDGNRNLVNWHDFPVKHVAINTGELLEGEPLLLHSSDYVGTNAIWPLRDFGERYRYQKQYGATRLKTEYRLTGKVD
jgi:hypothetical protein